MLYIQNFLSTKIILSTNRSFLDENINKKYKLKYECVVRQVVKPLLMKFIIRGGNLCHVRVDSNFSCCVQVDPHITTTHSFNKNVTQICIVTLNINTLRVNLFT